MSREFGSYTAGYFHDQIRQGAEDCLGGRDELTRLWGEFLREFAEIARAISGAEECDNGPEYPIEETISRLPALRRHLRAIETYVDPFKRIAEDAVRRALDERREQAS
jgi:hypothetical protein